MLGTKLMKIILNRDEKIRTNEKYLTWEIV